MVSELKTTLRKPKTKQGLRALQKREPKVKEDLKKLLALTGGKTSQMGKDVLADISKLTKQYCVRYSRKNPDVRPFESGGEASLEFFATKADCGLFLLSSHSKKRPHNITLGRMFDGRLLDVMELGVEQFQSLSSFRAASNVQLGNKPCMAFAGAGFEEDPVLRLAKSLLLDLFRGKVVENINLKGLTNIMFVTHCRKQIILRQYAVRFKKAGGMVPRTELEEMGPELLMSVRRHRDAPEDMWREAMKQQKQTKKKEKNVSSDILDGKVGRIYMPDQKVDTIATHKPKGLKRERREAAAEHREAKKANSSRAPAS